MAAGKDFAIAFMRRHNLSLRTPRKTSVARTMGFNRVQIGHYFDNLKEAYQKYGFTPDRIFNVDETGIQTVPGKLPKIVSNIGQKEVSKNVSAEQGQTVTVVCCLSAIGGYIPPYFIFRRKRMNPLLIKNGPQGCNMAVTDKGYMDSPTFIKWLDHFVEFSKPTVEKPVLLILDNHASHTNLEAVTHAKSNNVVLLSLPPHTSHKTQPLDRVFFKPLKSNYDQVADNWQSSHPGQTITLYDVAELFKTAYERTATVEKAIVSFRVTGIYPLDSTIFSEEDFLPSEVTEQNIDEIDEEHGVMVTFPGDNEPTANHVDHISDGSVQEPPAIYEAEQEFPAIHETEQEFPAIPGSSRVGDFTLPISRITVANVTAVSPADIMPLPKLSKRRKRTKKGLKSTILTSTPNKLLLEEKANEKKNLVKQMSVKKVTKTLFSEEKDEKSKVDSGSSSQSDTEMSLHDDSLDDISFEFEESEEDGNEEIVAGSYALVKVYGKKSFRLFVAKILERVEEGFKVKFFKKAQKTMKFSETSEENTVSYSDVIKKLSQPILGSSGRFQGMLTFPNNFDQYENILG